MTTVAIVDDMPEVRTLLRIALGVETGLEVVAEVDEGPAAVGLILEVQPDVVVIDLHLPGCSGVEVVRRIREAGGDPKVVMYCAQDRDDLPSTAQLMDSYVVKGTEVRTLLDVLATVSELDP